MGQVVGRYLVSPSLFFFSKRSTRDDIQHRQVVGICVFACLFSFVSCHFVSALRPFFADKICPRTAVYFPFII